MNDDNPWVQIIYSLLVHTALYDECIRFIFRMLEELISNETECDFVWQADIIYCLVWKFDKMGIFVISCPTDLIGIFLFNGFKG